MPEGLGGNFEFTRFLKLAIDLVFLDRLYDSGEVVAPATFQPGHVLRIPFHAIGLAVRQRG